MQYKFVPWLQTGIMVGVVNAIVITILLMIVSAIGLAIFGENPMGLIGLVGGIGLVGIIALAAASAIIWTIAGFVYSILYNMLDFDKNAILVLSFVIVNAASMMMTNSFALSGLLTSVVSAYIAIEVARWANKMIHIKDFPL